MKTAVITALLAVATAGIFSAETKPVCHIWEDTAAPSYDTTWTEGGAKWRQIYICDRNENTETLIIIRNDSLILWNVNKIK
nr:MAG TPA: hypothetical protein [Caudoviricetes sp.]